MRSSHINIDICILNVMTRFTLKFYVPIMCLTDGCSMRGELINLVGPMPENELDLFYEGYDANEAADHCPVCHKLGIALAPEVR